MSVLTDAIDAAEARKASALGDDHLVSFPDDFQQRAVFSGFDIDNNEFKEIAERAGYFFARMAADGEMPLHNVFASTWVDAFLTGLMVQRNGDG